MTKDLQSGIPFSTPPGTRYEYSNYAFGLLGRVVSKAAGVPYDVYVKTEVLAKLHMDSSTFHYKTVPPERRARGYRLKPDGTYQEETPLPHGAFGSMGGLMTTAGDMGKYVAFQLSAWPARDEVEQGPVRRASVREMNHQWRPANLMARIVDGKVQATASGYGFGLRIGSNCRFDWIVGHGGGLPGFGSYMLWLPDYGVGLFAMANLTYVGPAAPINAALDVLAASGGLSKREIPASSPLLQAQKQVVGLWERWDESEARKMAAMNLFLDKPVSQRMAEMEKIKQDVGACQSHTAVRAENWLRGQFDFECAKGRVGVFITMAPTQPPKVQHLEFRELQDSERMSAPTGAPAGVSCAP